MIPIITQKVKEKFFTKGQGNLAMQIAYGFIPELTSEEMRNAGFGYNLVWDTLKKLLSLEVLKKQQLRKYGRYYKTIYVPIVNDTIKEIPDVETGEEIGEKKDQKNSLNYIQEWNKLAKKSEFDFKPISERAIGIYEEGILAFQEFGDLNDFSEAVEDLMKLPYFRGNNNRGYILSFSFLLKREKFKKYLDGDYFEKQSTPIPNIIPKTTPKPTPKVVKKKRKVVHSQEKIDQFEDYCNKYYPKAGGEKVPDSQKVEAVDRLETEKGFKYVCDQAKDSVKSLKYLPQPKNFFDQSYKNNYLKYAPEPKPAGVLSNNCNPDLSESVKNILTERFPDRASIFNAVEYRFAQDQNLLEIWSDEEFYLNWLQDNHFDKKIQRILMGIRSQMFSINFHIVKL